MPKLYAKMPDECATRVAHLLRCFHPRLVEVGLRVDLLSIADDEGEPCLMHQGYPAAAVVRIVDSKGRTMGRGDCEIVIDEATYLDLSDAEKDALLDHELYHVELKTEIDKETEEERVKLDQNGRPKLKLRKHDVDVGWFKEIAERHGAASMERKQAQQIFLTGRQSFFDFIGETAPKLLGEPSEKVKEIAKEIMGASPAVRDAAKNFVRNMRKGLGDGSVSISSGGKPTTITADDVRTERTNVTTADGRQITPSQMVAEIKDKFAK